MNQVRTSSLPVPEPPAEPESLPYWDAASTGELVLPFCGVCDDYFWYPRSFCPSCGGGDLEWRQSDGRGVVHSFTVVRRALGDWRGHAPYVVATVRLAEGPVVAANLVGERALDIAVDDSVVAVFESSDGEDARVILRFEPRDASPEPGPAS